MFNRLIHSRRKEGGRRGEEGILCDLGALYGMICGTVHTYRMYESVCRRETRIAYSYSREYTQQVTRNKAAMNRIFVSIAPKPPQTKCV